MKRIEPPRRKGRKENAKKVLKLKHFAFFASWRFNCVLVPSIVTMRGRSPALPLSIPHFSSSCSSCLRGSTALPCRHPSCS